MKTAAGVVILVMLSWGMIISVHHISKRTQKLTSQRWAAVIAMFVIVGGFILITTIGNENQLTIVAFFQALGFEILGAGLTFIYLELALTQVTNHNSQADEAKRIAELETQIKKLEILVTELDKKIPNISSHNSNQSLVTDSTEYMQQI